MRLLSRRWRPWGPWVLAAVLSLAVTPALARDNVLRIGNGAEPQTLDPQKIETVDGSRIVRDLCEGLTGVAPDGRLIPAGAERWEVSADGLAYTFWLRPQARWSNGDPVTAEDYAAGLQRAVDPKTGSSYAQMLEPVVNASEVMAGRYPPEALGVDVLGPLTLRIRLKGPTPFLLGLLSHTTTFPVHQPTLEQHGEQFARPGRMVCNGAYRLEEWVPQSHVRLGRNPHYREAARTRIASVIYYATEDANSALKSYRAGELDVATSFPAVQTPWVREHVGDQLRIATYLGISYYGFNLTRPPFKDNPLLRRALALAVDRDILVNKLGYGLSKPAYSFVPPGTENYSAQTPAWAGWTQEQRLAEARRLYAAAGYSRKNPARVEIRYNTSEDNKRVAVLIAAMWKQWLGVESTLANEEWKVFLNTRKLRKQTQVFRSGWIGDYNDPTTFLDILHSSHGQNDTGWSNPRFDGLLASAAREADPGRRRALLEQAERILLDEMPVIPLSFSTSRNLVKPWVRGWQDNILDYHYSKDLWIEGAR